MMHQSKNEEFEELAFEEQCKQVFETPISRKGDLIIRSQDPVRLVNSFSAEELYLTVREMDGSNVSEIIQYANTEQLQFISDFECWQQDCISERGFIRWLEYLEAAGDMKVLQWLATAEFGMLIAGFKKYITVLKPDHEETVDEVIGDHLYFTLDNLYYIMIDEANMQTVKHAVSILFEKAKHLYINLVEGIMSETDDNIEEEAFQSRTVRLSEKGFPEKMEAMRIYRPVSDDEWQRYARRETADHKQQNLDAQILPLYPAVWREEKLFLDDVFATLGDVPREAVQAIYQELVWLSNKILICQGADEFGEKLVKKSFNHARHILNCALEDLSGMDILKARTFLIECWVEYLFRWGITRINSVRKAAEDTIKNYWDYSLAIAFDFFDEPYGHMLRGLLKTHPQFFDKSCSDDFYSLRDFRNTEDIKKAQDVTDVFTKVSQLLATRPFMGWDKYIKEFDYASHLDSNDVRISALVMTLFVQYTVNKKMRIKSLEEKELKSFMRTAFLGRRLSDDQLQLKPELKAVFISDLFHELHDFSREDFNKLKAFFDLCLDSGEEELGMFRKNEKPDYRFIQSVLMRPSNNH